MTSGGLDWDREKWRGSVASKFIRGGEKNAVKYSLKKMTRNTMVSGCINLKLHDFVATKLLNILYKIKRLVDNTRYSFRIAQKCDPVIGMVTLGDTVIFRNRGSLGKKCSLLLHKLVQQYLGRKYGYVFDAYNTNTNDKGTCIKENDPIWIFWWQGMQLAEPQQNN